MTGQKASYSYFSEDWPLAPDGKTTVEIRVDKNSSTEDIELEIEYWAEQITELGKPHSIAIMKAIRWMNEMLSGRMTK